MVALFTVDAVLSSLVRNQWPHDDDDDGLDVGDWLLFAAEETGLNVLGAFPGGSSLVSGMRGFDQQGVLSAAWSKVGRLATQVKQGEWDRALLKSSVVVAGAFTGLPSAQINKTIDAINARADGYDVSPYEYFTGPKKD
jgi:hypothetical protein